MKQLILICVLCITGSFAYAGCFGSNHVPGTSGDSRICKEKASLKADLEDAENQAQLERDRAKYKKRIAATKNNGSSSQSTGNQITQNIGAGLLGGLTGAKELLPIYESPITSTIHQFELNYSAYIFPSMAGFERQMPQIRPNAFSWIYNLSKTFAVVGMYQLFTLKGAQFDPIKEMRTVDEQITVIDPDTGEETLATRSVEKEFVIYQPGATSSEYTRFLYFVQISGEIGDKYATYARLGSGMSKAKVEYSLIDADGKETKETEEYTSTQPWAFEFGLRRTFGGINTGFYTRIIEGDNGESDYLKYIDMSTIEFGVNVTFGLPSLGLI